MWGSLRLTPITLHFIVIFLTVLDMADLEAVLRKAIVDGQPRTHRPWKKILIIVEGVYRLDVPTVRMLTRDWL